MQKVISGESLTPVAAGRKEGLEPATSGVTDQFRGSPGEQRWMRHPSGHAALPGSSAALRMVQRTRFGRLPPIAAPQSTSRDMGRTLTRKPVPTTCPRDSTLDVVEPKPPGAYADAVSGVRARSSVCLIVSLRPTSVARATSSAASSARAWSTNSRPGVSSE